MFAELQICFGIQAVAFLFLVLEEKVHAAQDGGLMYIHSNIFNVVQQPLNYFFSECDLSISSSFEIYQRKLILAWPLMGKGQFHSHGCREWRTFFLQQFQKMVILALPTGMIAACALPVVQIIVLAKIASVFIGKSICQLHEQAPSELEVLTSNIFDTFIQSFHQQFSSYQVLFSLKFPSSIVAEFFRGLFPKQTRVK